MLPEKPNSLIERAKLFWHRILVMESSPRAIALGTAVGIFVAFTPTIGVHMLLAAGLAALLRANPIPAAAMAWISNPLTIPPIFTLTYKIGILFWTPRSTLNVEEQLKRLIALTTKSTQHEVANPLREAMQLGTDFFMPLLIGGSLLGLALAALSYPVVLWAVVRARQAIAWRHYLHTQRHQSD